MKRGIVTVIAFLIAYSGCYAEFDSVVTQPKYATEPGYVHWPAPQPPPSAQPSNNPRYPQ